MSELRKYLHILKKLHIDRSHGKAPHKPILLLSVLQAFNENLITDQRIYITPELVGLFKSNWSSLVITNHDCRISYPFYYLKSDGFWKLIPKSGFENINQLASIMGSFSNLNAAIEYAFIDNDLFLLMKDKQSNGILQQFILDEYFPDTKNRLSNSFISQRKHFDVIEEKILSEDSTEYRKEIEQLILQKNEEEIFLRGSLFKREIPKIYNNSCCISGMRIDTSISMSMIDACHIVPFSVSFDDTITNGIALCPNLHRAFDRGLITIDSDYKVVVSSRFKEDENNYSIRRFKNRLINLPHNQEFFPKVDNFKWHNENVFKN